MVLSIVVALVVAQSGQLIWSGPRVFVLTGHSGVHIYHVRFEQANFKPRGRTIVWKSDHDPKYPAYTAAFKVGSQLIPFFGRDATEDISVTAVHELMQNTTELVDLSLEVDGKRWAVPKSAYDDLLDPNLDKQHVSVSLSKTGKAVFLRMENSDGSGSYNVRWVFRKSRPFTRSVEMEHD